MEGSRFDVCLRILAISHVSQTCFMGFDRDHSGTMEPHELQQALTTFGYRLTPQTLAVLNSRYSSNGKVGFDDFVALCIKLRALTCEYKYLYAAIIFLTSLISLSSSFSSPGHHEERHCNISI